MKETPMKEELESPGRSCANTFGKKRIEVMLLLILGTLVGFSAKTEASKRITMGSDDYLLSQRDVRAYDLNTMQKNLIANGDGASMASPQVAGGSCGQ